MKQKISDLINTHISYTNLKELDNHIENLNGRIEYLWVIYSNLSPSEKRLLSAQIVNYLNKLDVDLKYLIMNTNG